MAVRFIADSGCDILPAEAEAMGIIHLPLKVIFGETEYRDAVDLSHREFYERLVESDQLPTTCQVPPAEFADAYEKVVSAGDTAVVVTVSGKLSGTYQSAVIAAEDFPGRVHVVDSKNVALGSAVLADYALQLADQGLDAAAIAEKLTAERENVHLIALLDTLEYLKRGGRISKTVALAGGLLSIKPAISLDGGEVKLIGTARGAKQGTALMDQKILAAGDIDFTRPVLMGYTGKGEGQLSKYMAESTLLQGHGDLPVTLVSSVVGTHAGPGVCAIGFFQKTAE